MLLRAALLIPPPVRTPPQFDAIKKYVEDGGSVLICMGEGGEARYGTNVNYLLEEFGIAINSDSVVRTVFHKYLHPKEVFIGSSGVLSDGIVEAANRGNRKDGGSRAKPTTANEASELKARCVVLSLFVFMALYVALVFWSVGRSVCLCLCVSLAL